MPSQSHTDHVRKRCECTNWKECTHPWYIDFQEGRRRYRPNLDVLIGRHATDFAEAKKEARRAINAWLNGLDVRELLPGDAPTLTVVLDAYGKRPGKAPNDPYQRKAVIQTVVNGRPLGEWLATEITRDMIEGFRRQRPRVAGNRDLALLRAMFNWAVLSGLIPATPFKVGTVSAVKLVREEGRTRRLHPGEAERLLLAAQGLVRDLVVAALETGCRLSELLSLQWLQVREDLFLPAGKTKAKKARRVPISTVLQAVLGARRLNAAGEPFPPSAFVFGDEAGRRRTSVKTAWTNTVLKANGFTPARTDTGNPTSESRAAYKAVGLRFHDLRREAGSRWMDAGVPLATIQRWLGHYNISQTSTYLAGTGAGDADAMRAFEVATGRVTRGDAFAGSKASEPDQSTSGPNENVQSIAVDDGPSGVVH